MSVYAVNTVASLKHTRRISGLVSALCFAVMMSYNVVYIIFRPASDSPCAHFVDKHIGGSNIILYRGAPLNSLSGAPQIFFYRGGGGVAAEFFIRGAYEFIIKGRHNIFSSSLIEFTFSQLLLFLWLDLGIWITSVSKTLFNFAFKIRNKSPQN